MTGREFVELFYNDKSEYLEMCLNEDSNILVTSKIKELGLNESQKKVMAEVVNGILSDVYYGILLGLDGCAAIGRYQYAYKLYDEDGNLLTDGGNIEGYAYEFFQDKR